MLVDIIIWIFGILFAYRFFRYISTPIFKRTGVYTYYSKMFFTVPLYYRTIEIHLGTTWDFMKLQRINPVIIMLHLANGLVILADKVKKGIVHPDTIVRGTIHYFNPETLKKFGFDIRRPNGFELFMFTLSYVELCILVSISRGRFTIVNYNDIRIISIRAGDMTVHRDKYLMVARRMAKRIKETGHLADLTFLEGTEVLKSAS